MTFPFSVSVPTSFLLYPANIWQNIPSYKMALLAFSYFSLSFLQFPTNISEKKKAHHLLNTHICFSSQIKHHIIGNPVLEIHNGTGTKQTLF